MYVAGNLKTFWPFFFVCFYFTWEVKEEKKGAWCDKCQIKPKRRSSQTFMIKESLKSREDFSFNVSYFGY